MEVQVPGSRADGASGALYGGDLLGNVWRFDLSTKATPFRMAILKDASGNLQPVTAAPEHFASKIVSGTPDVFSPPALGALVEKTAAEWKQTLTPEQRADFRKALERYADAEGQK